MRDRGIGKIWCRLLIAAAAAALPAMPVSAAAAPAPQAFPGTGGEQALAGTPERRATGSGAAARDEPSVPGSGGKPQPLPLPKAPFQFPAPYPSAAVDAGHPLGYGLKPEDTAVFGEDAASWRNGKAGLVSRVPAMSAGDTFRARTTGTYKFLFNGPVYGPAVSGQ